LIRCLSRRVFVSGANEVVDDAADQSVRPLPPRHLEGHLGSPG